MCVIIFKYETACLCTLEQPTWVLKETYLLLSERLRLRLYYLNKRNCYIIMDERYRSYQIQNYPMPKSTSLIASYHSHQYFYLFISISKKMKQARTIKIRLNSWTCCLNISKRTIRLQSSLRSYGTCIVLLVYYLC